MFDLLTHSRAVRVAEMRTIDPLISAFHGELLLELRQRFLPLVPGWAAEPLAMPCRRVLGCQITADRGNGARRHYDLLVCPLEPAVAIVTADERGLSPLCRQEIFFEDIGFQSPFFRLQLRDPACFAQGALRAMKLLLAAEGMLFDQGRAVVACDAAPPVVEAELQAKLLAIKAVLLAAEVRRGNHHAGAALLGRCQCQTVHRLSVRRDLMGLKQAFLYTLAAAESARPRQRREIVELAQQLAQRLDASGIPNPLPFYRMLEGSRSHHPAQLKRAVRWGSAFDLALDSFICNCPLSTLAHRQGLQ